jgi:membrane fusion protein, heavy metal efflux system
LGLAEINLKSAAELHDKKIMPDLEFLAVQKAKAEATIELEAAENKLHALGLNDAEVRSVPANSDELALCELRAPFAGTVVEKHCALGEVLSEENAAFMLADLSSVWAQITVYTQDMAKVRKGQTVEIRANGLDTSATGTISYLAPVANEATRSVSARVDLPNAQRQWRPGTFVTAAIVLDRQTLPVVVPIDSLQRVKSDSVVFVQEGEGFVPRTVTVGRMNHTQAEITGGLKAGERLVVKGAVVLKAELGKREAVHEH